MLKPETDGNAHCAFDRLVSEVSVAPSNLSMTSDARNYH
jgi:hypothetical protein